MRQSIYIYAQQPGALEFETLGKLTVENGEGEWIYSPLYNGAWVPDEVHYPLPPLQDRGRVFLIKNNNGLPGFILDLVPDNWGKSLIKKVVTKDIGHEFTDLDYLLLAQNKDRSGNLAVGSNKKPPKNLTIENFPKFERAGDFIQLVELIRSGQAIENINLALFQTSSGGARPKITLRDEHDLYLAKPKDRDELVDIPTVEFLCLHFAATKGLNVADHSLEIISHQDIEKSLLVLKRFDRTYNEEYQVFERHPMVSALTLLDAEWPIDNSNRWSYPLLANEMLRKKIPLEDIHELYRRMAFNALIGNDDDHPKNHAFIFIQEQWRLAPLFDVVPHYGYSPPRLAMKIGVQDSLINRGNFLSQCSHFFLTEVEAAEILDEVASWEDELRKLYSQNLTSNDFNLVNMALDGTKLLK